MSHLDALLNELREKADALAKAQPAAVAPTVEAEAPVAKAEPTETIVEPAPAEPEAAAAAEAPAAPPAEPVAKSFKVKDADGNEHDAVDGFALIKALGDDLAAVRAELAEIKGSLEAAPKVDAEALTKSFTDQFAGVTTGSEEMAKALGATMDALAQTRATLEAADARIAEQAAASAAQAEVIKSLAATVEQYGAKGVGRVSTVSVVEKTSPVSVQKAQPTMGEVFAKALELNKQGTLNALDVSTVTAWVQGGRGIPPHLAHHFAA